MACLAWVGGISLALVYFLELSNAIGWAIAGTLGVLCTVAACVLLFEFRHAIDLTEIVDEAEFDSYPGPTLTNPTAVVPPTSGVPVPSFSVSNKTR